MASIAQWTMGHRMKVAKQRVAAAKKGETGTIDRNYLEKEEIFLVHYKTTKRVYRSLTAYADALKAMAQAAVLAAEGVKTYYESSQSVKEPAARFHKATEQIEQSAGSLEDAFRKKILNPLGEYLTALKFLKDQRKEREVCLQDFDYYRCKVKVLRDKPGNETQNMSRNEAKMHQAEDIYRKLNEDLTKAFDQITQERFIFFNPMFTTLLGSELNFFGNSFKSIQPLAKVADSPQECGIDVKSVPKFDIGPILRMASEADAMEKKGDKKKKTASIRLSSSKGYDVRTSDSPRGVSGREQSAGDRDNDYDRDQSPSTLGRGSSPTGARKDTSSEWATFDNNVGSGNSNTTTNWNGKAAQVDLLDMPPMDPMGARPPQAVPAGWGTMSPDPMAWPSGTPTSLSPPAIVADSRGRHNGGTGTEDLFQSLRLQTASPPQANHNPFAAQSNPFNNSGMGMNMGGGTPSMSISMQQPGGGMQSMVMPTAMGGMQYGAPPPQQQQQQVRSEQCQALYNYNAENEQELSLRKGDVVNIIRKEEGGWWEGECQGRRGLFPGNYVKVL